jgi:integrase
VLTRLTRERDRGLPILSNERLTLAAFLNDWLERHSGSVRYPTARRYSEALRLHVIPTLGRMPLTKLSAHRQSASTMICAQSPSRRMASRYPLRPSTGSTQRYTLRWKPCRKGGFIPRNVSDQARRPREEKHQSRVFTPDEFYTFCEAIQGDLPAGYHYRYAGK